MGSLKEREGWRGDKPTRSCEITRIVDLNKSADVYQFYEWHDPNTQICAKRIAENGRAPKTSPDVLNLGIIVYLFYLARFFSKRQMPPSYLFYVTINAYRTVILKFITSF